MQRVALKKVHRGLFHLGELLALHVHVFDVDVFPGGRLPLVDGGPDQEDVIPKLLQHLDLLPALPQGPELRNLDFEQR